LRWCFNRCIFGQFQSLVGRLETVGHRLDPR